MRKILIVDDSQDTRYFCEMIAQLMDSETELAGNANIALTKLQSGYKPDVILTDLIMPGIDPKLMIDYVGEHLPDAKVILMSAENDVDFYANEMGADAAISKPLDVNSLVAKIGELTAS